MDNLFQDLMHIPGVKAVSSFDQATGKVLDSTAEPDVVSKLTNACRLLSNMANLSHMHFEDTRAISINYLSDVIYIRQTDSGQSFIIQHEPHVTLQKMNAVFTAKKPKELSEAEKKSPEAKARPIKLNPRSQARRMIQSGPMSEGLKGMQKALSKIMGPMAPVIFEASLAKWVSSGSVSGDSLPQFIDILHRDIGDTKKIQRYQKMISPHLKSIRAVKG